MKENLQGKAQENLQDKHKQTYGKMKKIDQETQDNLQKKNLHGNQENLKENKEIDRKIQKMQEGMGKIYKKIKKIFRKQRKFLGKSQTSGRK